MQRTHKKHKKQIKNLPLSHRKDNKNGHQPSILRGDGRVYSSEGVQPMEPDNGSKTITVVKTVINQAIITSTTGLVANISKQFTLADVDDYTSYTAAFDQYRIAQIECYISPQGSNTNLTNDGKITSVIDFDDAATVTGLALLDYSNAVTCSRLSNQYRHFVPHVADAVYGSSAFSSFGNLTAPWIDCSSPNVAHYGLKLFLTVSSSNSSAVDLTYRMHIQFMKAR